MGDRDQAIDHLLQSLHYATKGREGNLDVALRADDTIDPAETWALLDRLGRLLQERANKAGDATARRSGLEAALRRYRQAMSIIESTRRRQDVNSIAEKERARLGYTRNKEKVYQATFELLLELEASAPGRGAAQEALECVERSKSQTLLELLRERNLEAGREPEVASTPAMLDRLAQSKLMVVEYYLTDRAAYVFCLGGVGRKFVVSALKEGDVSLSPRELEGRVGTLIAALSTPDSPLDEVRGQARALYEILFPAPVRAALGSAPGVVIVPHGFLHLLPFQALRDEKGDLYASRSLTFAPSTGLIFYARERRSQAAGTGAALLSIINPGNAKDLHGHADHQEADLPLLFPSPPSRHYTRTADPGTSRATQMTRDRLLEEAKDFDYVNIYSHADFLSTDPLGSFIEVSGGRLRAADIYEAIQQRRGFAIRARLVTLAACETGRGKVVAGDEVLGLPRAFLHAGASSMMISLWRADATFTDRLMARLYEKLADGRTGVREAFRRALDETIGEDQRRYPHPFYWAPFIFFGDPS
jgi:CHAT domain-containing protein